MQIKIIRSEEQWGALTAEWNQLLDKSMTNAPFLRHEFLIAWWQHRGGGEWESDELYIVIARDETDTLVGAAPFFISKNRAGEPALILMGSVEIADFLDILAQPKSLDAFLKALFEHLTGSQAPPWKTLELYNLLDSSPTLLALESAAKAAGLSFEQQRLGPAPMITLPEDFDSYLATLDKRYQRELMRKIRNTLGYFIPVKVIRVGENDDLHAEMEAFFTLMREESQKDIFLTPKMIEQMHAIAQAGSAHGWLDLRFLVVGNQKAAGYLNFDYQDSIYVYNSGHSSRFSNLSPGIVLAGLLIEDAIDNGYRYFDMLRGDEEYKYQLGGQDRWVLQATLRR